MAFAVASPTNKVVRRCDLNQIRRVEPGDRRGFLFGTPANWIFCRLAFDDDLTADLAFLNLADRFFDDLFVLHHNVLLNEDQARRPAPSFRPGPSAWRSEKN